MTKYFPAVVRNNPWAAGAALAILGVALWNWYQVRSGAGAAAASAAAPAPTQTRGLQSLSRMRGIDLTDSLSDTGDVYAGGGLLGLPR